MHRHPSLSRARGTTLIEAMAALVVFTVGILGVMQMNVLASRQNNLARGEAAASKIARDLAYNFERLPYDHPIFSQSPSSGYLVHTDPAFTDFTNTTGLVKLSDVPALIASKARPLSGSAEAMVTVEGGATNVSGFGTYEVAWRAAPFFDPDPAYASTTPEARIIVIMVRFKTVLNTYRQVNVYTVKYNPEAIIDANALIQEI